MEPDWEFLVITLGMLFSYAIGFYSGNGVKK
jgi:hypothetical protein